MFYVTVPQSPAYHQMTLEEFLFGNDSRVPLYVSNETNTRTYETEYIGEKFQGLVDIDNIINKLKQFNEQTEELRKVPRKELYSEFYIPKKSGGLRLIDAPNEELKAALRNLKAIFEEDCHALYHTSAFAYIKKRSTIDSIKRHQKNGSKWFAKFDLSNFFGSTTLKYVMDMLQWIFPFSQVCLDDVGRAELEKALELAFLDGGLPQGTPISPIITNIIMIPVDFKLYNGFRNFKYHDKDGNEVENYCVYTRYADDFLVSCRYDFNYKEAEAFIVDTLASFDAPFTIKSKKTRYGSSSGSNWNLGVMLNADNEITIGHKRRKQFTAMLSNYAMDKKNGTQWDFHDVQVLEGHRSYYMMIERESISALVEHLSKKFNMDIVAEIKNDLRGGVLS